MRYPLFGLLFLTCGLGLYFGLAPWGENSVPPTPSSGHPSEQTETNPAIQGPVWFEDVTQAAGLDFQHFNSATPQHYIQETMGSGLAWIDYDRDGWPDLFCVQSGPVQSSAISTPAPTHRLYRNLGNGRFRDVTEETGVGFSGFGMGVAVGDFDNDGYDDLLISELGGVRLLHNQPVADGTRRFVDITLSSGLTNPHWATSCAWGDIDGDGWLDLYVANYVEVDLANPLVCKDFKTGLPQSCTPTAYPHVSHRLFRNRRDGTFEDISRSSGIASVPPAPGLGVVIVDLDDDGHPDIYVANDMKPAYLFHNSGKGDFAEKAVSRGCALGRNGNTMAGMGVIAADLDGTGRPSLLVTNFHHEPNVLFLNRGQLRFQEWSSPSGLGLTSLQRLGFGAVALDANADGYLDVAVANGHVNREAERMGAAQYAQEAQLYLGQGQGRFREISQEAGAVFRRRTVGRGLAVADFDRDGRPDLAISTNAGPILLLRNRTEIANHSLALELVGDGVKSNTNAIGARVKIESASGQQTHFLIGGGSYLSSNERQLLMGLGEDQQADRVEVRWPSGQVQVFLALSAGRGYRLTEGQSGAKELAEFRRPPS